MCQCPLAVSVLPGFAPIDSPMSQVSLFSTGLLSPSQVQLDFDGSREDQCSLSHSTIVSDDRLSPVSPTLPRSSSSIDSERSDESFYIAVDSPAVQTPALIACCACPRSFAKNLLRRQLPTLGSGINRGVVPTGSRHIRTTTTCLRMDSLVCRLITHSSWSAWGLRNPPAYLDVPPVSGSGP